MQHEKTAGRCLRSAAAAAAGLDVALFGAGEPRWGWGFAIGALVSLFSLGSLLVLVPMLVRPHAPPQTKGMLAATLFMKLPLYAIALSLASPRHGVEPVATGLGIALIPMVLTFRTAASILMEGAREQRADLAVAEAASMPKIDAPPLPGVGPEPTQRGLPRLPQPIYPVREGA